MGYFSSLLTGHFAVGGNCSPEFSFTSARSGSDVLVYIKATNKLIVTCLLLVPMNVYVTFVCSHFS